jgi:hypothetical protein
MATVTYKAQPAIDKTRGAVPLEGTRYPYTVKQLLWNDKVHAAIDRMIKGRNLHVCCGYSRAGCDGKRQGVRVDLNPEVKPDVIADAAKLPFADESFDTVFCDPPYNGKMQWNHDMLSELARVASSRIVFQHWFIPADQDGRYKKAHRFRLTEMYAWQGQTYFGRAQIISVFDSVPKQLDLFGEERYII